MTLMPGQTFLDAGTGSTADTLKDLLLIKIEFEVFTNYFTLHFNQPFFSAVNNTTI